MDVVGGAILSAFFQLLFQKLASKHVVDFIRRRRDIQEELNLLKMTWRRVIPFLNDAENKQYKDELVKNWLDDLRDASYDAEDVIDELATEAKTGSDQGWSVIQAINSTVQTVRAVPMLDRIKGIITRFNELEGERSVLGLKEIDESQVYDSTSSTSFRETSSVVDESQVYYGRDDDKEKIIVQLLKKECATRDDVQSLKKESSSRDDVQPLNEESATRDDVQPLNELCRIIPIVGMGGVGKTTLAQLVYNDNQVKNHFNLKAWVCVSDDFDIKRITKAILESVTLSPCHFNDLNSLQVGVKEALIGKKFLIILDDVWNKNYENWDLLRRPFGVGVSGSAIIVTTRDNEIASKMGTVGSHPLRQLSDGDCWRVFIQHAFGIKSVDANPNLAEIGKEIVRKCKGLPLAAKSLGGLLRTKEEEYEWENVLNCKIWDLPEEENGILSVLKLSYHYLPSHLKRCFAYCSIFPKDYEIDGGNLVSLWMAEGFLHQPKGDINMEDFGHKCFLELLSRSFFQPSSNIKSLFVMHDLMNDLAEWASGKTCFRKEDRSTQCEISNNARYSSYISGQFDGVQQLKAFNEVGRLRTFLPLDIQRVYGGRYLTNVVTFDLLSKLTFLRVLSLRGYHITKLPELDGLKHLRYFDLSETDIDSLPESLTTRYNLQTLLFEKCSSLKKLPVELTNLADLRHLDISNVTSIVMPAEVGRLTNLRKLSDFIVGKEENGPGLGQLKNLKHLQGTLRISSLENVIDAKEANDANLSEKNGLNVLKMEWRSKSNDTRDQRVQTEVLAMLSPPKKLKELTIKGYDGISFPQWIGPSHFSNMVLLELNGCERCSVLPPLGNLPLLKDLRIRELHAVVTVGPQFYGNDCSNSFPSLEKLRFEKMNEWRDWIGDDVDNKNNLFPRLRELSITTCPKLLGKLPDHIPSLENLTVDRCVELTIMLSSVPRLCNLYIRECKEVVQSNNGDLSSLKSTTLEHIRKGTFITNGFIKGLTGVEDLTINECYELMCLWQKEVSLHNLTSLRKLTIQRCNNIKSLYEGCLSDMLSKLSISSEPSSGHSCNNSSLEYLEIIGCGSLMFIGEDWLFPTVKEVHIYRCDGLQYLLHKGEASSSVSSSSSSSMMMMMEDSNNTNTSLLELLSIKGCHSLTSLFSPSSIGALPATLKTLCIYNCAKLASIGTRLNNYTCLVRVEISFCGSFKTLPSGLHYLHHLVIGFCKNFVSFPEEGLPATLKSLRVEWCPKLESIGEIFHSETSLEIYIRDCKSLKYLPENLTRLSQLTIWNSPRLVRFPDRSDSNTYQNLKELDVVYCGKLKGLSNCIHGLTSLKKLCIMGCPSSTTMSFPEKGFLTNNITQLEIVDLKLCKPLLVEWDLGRLTSLKGLSIGEGVFPEMVSFPAEEKEMRMVLPSSLLKMTIRDLPNLVSLSSKGFQNLTSLEELTISDCPKLQSFPDKGLFPSILALRIDNCPLMKQRLSEADRGQDWPKISHIPFYKYYDWSSSLSMKDELEKMRRPGSDEDEESSSDEEPELEEMEESDEEEEKQVRTQLSSVD